MMALRGGMASLHRGRSNTVQSAVTEQVAGERRQVNNVRREEERESERVQI